MGLPASRADRVAAATAELERFFPHPERPTHSYATDWAGDPFTQGGYTRLAPGSDITDIEQLAKPHDRIHFAGEATSSLRYGYADGAFASGIREANRILELTTH